MRESEFDTIIAAYQEYLCEKVLYKPTYVLVLAASNIFIFDTITGEKVVAFEVSTPPPQDLFEDEERKDSVEMAIIS